MVKLFFFFFFEEIGVNETNGLRECINCHKWYFLEKNYKIQTKVRDDLMKKL